MSAEPSTERYSEKDFALRRAGMPAKTEDEIKAVRILVAAMADGANELNPSALATATGLSLRAVHHILSSEQYLSLIEDQLRQMSAPILMRGVRRCEQIISTGSDSMAIQAIRAVSSVYQTVTKVEPKHTAQEAERAVLEMLTNLKRVEFRLIPPNDSSKERPSDRSPTAPEGEDSGGH